MSKLRLVVAAVVVVFAVASVVTMTSPAVWADSHSACQNADGTPC